MTYDYTYAIGTDTAPVTINVKPEDELSLGVTGETVEGQVFVDKTSAADVLVKAYGTKQQEADDFETYTYKKTVVDSQRITIKETNRVVTTISNTAETEGTNIGKFQKTVVTWALNAQGVLTAGEPVVSYETEAGSGEAQTVSTFKKFTATYANNTWTDGQGEDWDGPQEASVTYTTTTSVYTYNSGYSDTPDAVATVVEGLEDPVLPSTTYQQYVNGSTTGTDITSDVTSATTENPYSYAQNNGSYETVVDTASEATTLFVIKNPTNIAKNTYTYYGHEETNEYTYPATISVTGNKTSIENLLATEFNVKANGTDFKGYANNDKAVSKDANETFKLGEGNNTIVLDTKQTKEVTENSVATTKVVGIGNDVVTLTRGENLNLQFDDGAKIEAVVKGNDVVFSTVQYYATAKMSGTAYGANFGTAEEPTTHTFQLRGAHLSSQAAMADSWGVVDEGDILWYDKESYGKNADNADTFVALDITDFATAANQVKDENGNIVSYKTKFGGTVDITDIKIFKVVNGEDIEITSTYLDDYEGTNVATDDSLARSLYLGQRVAGTVTVKDIWNKDVTGESDFVSGDTGLTVNGVDWKFMISNYNNADDKFEIEAKNKAITGTYKDELAVSGKDGETINLGSGSDKVVFRGDFGSDTVTVNKNENLSLEFATNSDDIVFTTKGKDIVATAKVSYYATATVTGTAYGHDFGAGTDASPATEYTFALRGSHLSSQAAMADSWGVVDEGDILWYADEPYGKNSDKVDTYLALDITDFATAANQDKNDTTDTTKITSYHTKFGGTADVTNIKIFKVVNGVETEITSTYLDDYEGTNVATDDSLARSLYNSQIDGTVTIKDYFGKDIEGAYVKVNDQDVYSYLKDYNPDFDALEVKPNKKTFTGTFRNEVAISTKDNETFNMGTGYDQLVFRGDFGSDTVKLTKGSNTTLFFLPQNSSDPYENMSDLVKFTTKGNDVVASIDVKYYATATVTGTAYGHDFGAGTDASPATEYTFALRGSHLSSQAAMADSWGVVDEGDILWYADEPYGKNSDKVDTYLALDITDFATAANQDKNDTTDTTKITSYHTKFGGTADVTNIKIFKVVNGVETEITSTYLDDYEGTNVATDDSLARSLYNSQISGSVTLKDFNAKDIQAYVSIGYGGDIRQLPSFIAANTYDSQEAFAGGKITTKAQNDVIDASNYNSPNGKGVTINSGSGNDRITGSNYNDKVTVKSLAGDHTTVVETSGTNKITTGKGDDTVVIGNVGINPQIANNTIKLGNGENSVTVNANGKNKITGGSDDDEFILNNGFNTVNGKNGDNTFVANNGNNKLTGGKNVDTFTLSGGQNTVKAGKGDDVVTANFGYNTIDLGAGNDEVLANGGYNVIKGSKGNNVYKLEGGSNVITGGSGVDEFKFNVDDTFAAPLNAIINGGKGNDIYDLTNADYQDSINITDTKGKNVVKLAKKDTILFDVTLGKNDKKDKAGKVLTFRNGVGDVSYTGSIKNVVVADANGDTVVDNTSYTLNVKGVAEQVASFMRTELGLGKGASAYDVLAAGGDNANKLLAIYQGTGVDVGADANKYVANIYKA